ncbi:MAG: hypothetical protein QHH14_12520 [Clostridiales bacterium]|nr:hypothetical protein [Clostridiales bacterium]
MRNAGKTGKKGGENTKILIHKQAKEWSVLTLLGKGSNSAPRFAKNVKLKI